MHEHLRDFVLAQASPPVHFEGSLLELLAASEHTTLFAECLSRYPSLVALLNEPSADLTIFAPTNQALASHHAASPLDLDEATLRYHILPTALPLSRILAITLSSAPTLLEPAGLNGPLRLNIAVDAQGLSIDASARATAFDTFARNSVVHSINQLLAVPPPRSQVVAQLPAATFGQFTRAFATTGLDAELKRAGTGGTVFAPTDAAFAALGEGVSRFLFEDDQGSRFLKALLRYHVVPQHTVYSNAYYGPPSPPVEETPETKAADVKAHSEANAAVPKVEDPRKPTFPRGRRHWDVPTLLAGDDLSVDVFRYGTLIALQVNGIAEFPAENIFANDGVIHPITKLLVPPELRAYTNGNGDITVEELQKGLEKYV
ncbi:hypothetical protein BP6252_06781 [Coleophoma cylindrospora]|uniref:FAS1 domain-containing protein n=1 Tax=Coleophoma cylindrospora TaxID=1849047 RepID=A0A3D8RG80_9HELO|nr:hypothetical protein BP6252_06781 [Coleophoma cylindrospora]